MEFCDEELTPLTSCTFEKKARTIQWNRGLIREKYSVAFKNLAKCAALTFCHELSRKKHLVCFAHTVYGTITEICRDYANRELMKSSR